MEETNILLNAEMYSIVTNKNTAEKYKYLGSNIGSHGVKRGITQAVYLVGLGWIELNEFMENYRL